MLVVPVLMVDHGYQKDMATFIVNTTLVKKKTDEQEIITVKQNFSQSVMQKKVDECATLVN